MTLQTINADRYRNLTRYRCSLFTLICSEARRCLWLKQVRGNRQLTCVFLAVTSQQCAPLSIAAERTTLISDRDVDFLSLSAKGSDLTSPLFILTHCSSGPIPMTPVVPTH